MSRTNKKIVDYKIVYLPKIILQTSLTLETNLGLTIRVHRLML